MSRPNRGGERDTRTAGRSAESLVAAWLGERGYRILARNHATRRGEVDLICEEGQTLCFVEVRSRANADFGNPALTVTRAKALRVVAAARDWVMRKKPGERPMRFDVVSVILGPETPRIELFRGAFDANGAFSP